MVQLRGVVRVDSSVLVLRTVKMARIDMAVNDFIRGCLDEQLENRWDPGDASVSSVSVTVSLLFTAMVATVKLKAPARKDYFEDKFNRQPSVAWGS